MIYDENLTKEEMQEKYEQRFGKIKDYFKKVLTEMGATGALKAFKLAEKHHSGRRKNGAPEFMHQLEICLFLTTLPQLPKGQDLDDFFTAALLHDVREDYGITYEEIEKEFNPQVAHLVELLTKEFNGVKKETQVYFDELSTNIFASLIKLADRFHNMSTMHDAFTYKKQREYIKEVKDYFYPFIKQCLKNYPDFNLSLYLIKTNIEVLTHTIQSSIVYIEKLEGQMNIVKKDLLVLGESIQVLNKSLNSGEKKLLQNQIDSKNENK